MINISMDRVEQKYISTAAIGGEQICTNCKNSEKQLMKMQCSDHVRKYLYRRRKEKWWLPSDPQIQQRRHELEVS